MEASYQLHVLVTSPLVVILPAHTTQRDDDVQRPSQPHKLNELHGSESLES